MAFILGDEAFALSQHTTILCQKFWCCLTWMVECAFGIYRNKWRIFHRAIDVCPDFCDVIVKTCCIPHNFVRQRDGFQFQDTLYEWPLESIKAVSTRFNVTGKAVREYCAT
jgi:hypothetical protein